MSLAKVIANVSSATILQYSDRLSAENTVDLSLRDFQHMNFHSQARPSAFHFQDLGGACSLLHEVS